MKSAEPSKRKREDRFDETIDTYAKFRRAIHAKGRLKAGVESARMRLAPDAVPQIIREASAEPLYRNVLVREPFPRSYNRLKLRRALPVVDDRVEALWTASILSLFQTEIASFVGERDRFYTAMAGGDYRIAEAALAEIQDRYGVSIWLISSRIALLQISEGTTAQKRYLQEILSTKGVSPTVGYLSFLFGFAADENVSVADLTREWSRLEELNISIETLHYFYYHVSTFSISQLDEPWHCLALEENSSIIDRFETFAEMSALAFIRADTVEHVSFLREGLFLLKDIPDKRIQNLLTLFGERFELKKELLSINEGLEASFSMDVEEARRIVLKAIANQPGEPALYEMAARIGVETGRSIRLENSSVFANSLIKHFEDVISVTDAFHESRFALQKMALLNRRLPIGRAIVSFLDKEQNRIVIKNSVEDEALWAISTSITDPDQLAILKKLNGDVMQKVASNIASYSPFYALYDAVLFPRDLSDEIIKCAPISERVRCLFLGHLEFTRGKFDKALNIYLKARDEFEGLERIELGRLIYEAARAIEDIDLALTVLTEAYFESEKAHLIFPMDYVAEWVRENTGLDKTCLNRAIALNIYLQHVSPKYDGDLSDAFEDVLEYYNVEKPSALLDKLESDSKNRQRWIYFFKEVATIRRLEDGIRLRNYEEIEAERIAVLTGLASRCSDIADQVTDQIVFLTQEREVSQLAEQFDRSRIYVNETGVKRFIDVEFQDVVARYKRLVESPGLQTDLVFLESILLKILKGAGDEFKTLTLPATEEEDLLYAIYSLMADAFVLNPDHGFKTYLTTRILHGSLEGELRSSFTRHKLLFQSFSEAEFDAGWSSQLRLGPGDYTAVRTAVLRFARRVSDSIAELKDKRIRIKSKETQNGVFDFTPTTQDIRQLREEAETAKTAEELADKLITRLWKKIDVALVSIQREMQHEFRRRIMQAAENLSASLSTLSSDVSLLQDALTNANTEFQTSLDRVLAWFTRSGTTVIKPFTVETAVQVAARLTSDRFPNRPIHPTVIASRVPNIRGSAFSPLLDILRNCFQNAIEYASENDQAPAATVKCEAHGDAFKFEVVNELPSRCDREEILRSVVAARAGKKSTTKQRTGRGTGLREIERVLAQEGVPGCELIVEISPESCFVVSFAIRGT